MKPYILVPEMRSFTFRSKGSLYLKAWRPNVGPVVSVCGPSLCGVSLTVGTSRTLGFSADFKHVESTMEPNNHSDWLFRIGKIGLTNSFCMWNWTGKSQTEMVKKTLKFDLSPVPDTGSEKPLEPVTSLHDFTLLVQFLLTFPSASSFLLPQPKDHKLLRWCLYLKFLREPFMCRPERTFVCHTVEAARNFTKRRNGVALSGPC